MTDRQARIVFDLLAILGLTRQRSSGQRVLDDVVAAAGIPRAELAAILDRFDAAVERACKEDRNEQTREDVLRRTADIAREVTAGDETGGGR